VSEIESDAQEAAYVLQHLSKADEAASGFAQHARSAAVRERETSLLTTYWSGIHLIIEMILVDRPCAAVTHPASHHS